MTAIGDFIARWPELAGSAGPPLFHHLWESTLFAAAVLALLVPLRRAPAVTRYRLCLLASSKFLVPSAALVSLAAALGARVDGLARPLPVAVAAVLRADGWAAALAAGVGERLAAGLPWLAAAVWLAGGLALAARQLRRGARLARAVAAARPLGADDDEERLRLAVGDARRRVGVEREVAVRISAAVGTPAVWGLRRPILLLPPGIFEHLAPAELEVVLLHELEHVRRRDNLFGLFQAALACLLWFHPLVWWLERRMLAERERACDDRVVELGAEPRLYARSLVKVLRFGLGGGMLGAPGAAAATASDLRRRLEHLIGGRRPERLRPLPRAALAAAVAVLVFTSLAAASPGPACALARACGFEVKLHPRYSPPAAAVRTIGEREDGGVHLPGSAGPAGDCAGVAGG